MTKKDQTATEDAWNQLVARIARVLAGFIAPDQQDKLILEIDNGTGAYAQICSLDGDQLHAELANSSFLDAGYGRVGDGPWLVAAGWHAPDAAHGPNPWQERPRSEGSSLAADVVRALREFFSAPDPAQIRLAAWGPHTTAPATWRSVVRETRVGRSHRRG